MKLRLPSKLVAAILAAASPVLLQTLSSATLGAAAVAVMTGQQAIASYNAETHTFSGTDNNNFQNNTLVSGNDHVIFNMTNSGTGNWFNSVTYAGDVLIGADGATDTGLCINNGNQGQTLTLSGTVTGTGLLSKVGNGDNSSIALTGNATGFTGNIKLGSNVTFTLRFGGGAAAPETTAEAGVSGTGSVTFNTDKDTLVYNYNANGGNPVYITNAISTSGSGVAKVTLQGGAAYTMTKDVTIDQLTLTNSSVTLAGTSTLKSVTGSGSIVNSGTLTIGDGISLGHTGGTQVADGGVLNLGTGVTLASGISNNGTGVVNVAGTLTNTGADSDFTQAKFTLTQATDSGNYTYGGMYTSMVSGNGVAESATLRRVLTGVTESAVEGAVVYVGEEAAATVWANNALNVKTDIGNYYVVNDTASFTDASVFNDTQGLIVQNNATMTLSVTSGEGGSIHGTVAVQNGATLKTTVGGTMGWGTTAVKKLIIDEGSTVELAHGGNEIFVGELVLNGTITGNSGSTWDMYTDSTLAVNAGKTATISTTNLRLRRDNVTFNVGTGATLNVTANITRNTDESNGTLVKSGAGVMNLTGTLGGISALSLQGGTLKLNHDITLNGANKITGSGDLQILGGTTQLGNGDNGSFTGNILVSGEGAMLKLLGNAKGLGEQNRDVPDKRYIKAENGGIINVNGWGDGNTNGYAITLGNNGTLMNERVSIDSGHMQIAKLIVTGSTAYINGTHEFGIVGSQHGGTTLTLNGNTLEKKGANNFMLINTTVNGGGTIRLTGGSIQIIKKDSNASGVNFEFNGGTLKLVNGLTLTAGGLTMNSAYTGNGSITDGGHLTLTLGNNANNTYRGTLAIGNLTVNGGQNRTQTLNLTGASTAGNISVTGGANMVLTSDNGAVLSAGQATVNNADSSFRIDGAQLNLTNNMQVSASGQTGHFTMTSGGLKATTMNLWRVADVNILGGSLEFTTSQGFTFNHSPGAAKSTTNMGYSSTSGLSADGAVVLKATSNDWSIKLTNDAILNLGNVTIDAANGSHNITLQSADSSSSGTLNLYGTVTNNAQFTLGGTLNILSDGKTEYYVADNTVNGFSQQYQQWVLVKGGEGATTTLADGTTVTDHATYGALTLTQTGSTVTAESAKTDSHIYYVGKENTAWNAEFAEASADATGYFVREGNTFTAAGTNLTGKELILNEGATFSSAAGGDFGSQQIQSLKLEGDATVAANSNVALIGSGYADTTLTLAGHTLNVTGSGHFALYNTTVDAGTIAIASGANLQTGHNGRAATINALDTLLSFDNGTLHFGSGASTVKAEGLTGTGTLAYEGDSTTRSLQIEANLSSTPYAFTGNLGTGGLNVTMLATSTGEQQFNLTQNATLGSITVNGGKLTFGGSSTLTAGAATLGNGTLALNTTANLTEITATGGTTSTLTGTGAISLSTATDEHGILVNNGATVNVEAASVTLANGSLYNKGTLNIGNGTDATLVKAKYLVNGNVNGGSATALTINSNATVAITGGDTNNTHATGLMFSEWNNNTTANIYGNLLAQNASFRGGDSNYTLNIADGGVLATLGFKYKQSTSGSSINLGSGGKLILGGTTTENKGTMTAEEGSTIGIYADTVTFSHDLTIGTTAAQGDALTIDTKKYAFNADGTAIAQADNATGGTLTISGNLSGDGALTVIGNGALELSGNNTYTGATTVTGGSVTYSNTYNGSVLNLSGDGTTVTFNGAGSGFRGNINASGGGTLNVGGTSTLSANTITITKGTELNFAQKVTLTSNSRPSFLYGESSTSEGTELNFNGGYAYTGTDPYAMVVGKQVTVSMGGTSDLTGKSIGMETGATLQLLNNATLTVGRIYNAASFTNNANVSMGAGSTLTLSGTDENRIVNLDMQTGATVNMLANTSLTAGRIYHSDTLSENGNISMGAGATLSVTGSDSNSIVSLDLGSGSTANFSNAATTIGTLSIDSGEATLKHGTNAVTANTTNLQDGETLNVFYSGTSGAVSLGAVALESGAATIKTTNHGGELNISTLSGTGTLTLRAQSDSAVTSTFNIGSTANTETLFNGTLVLDQANSAGGTRTITWLLKDDKTATNADVVLKRSTSGTNTVNAKLALDTAHVALKSLSDATGTGTYSTSVFHIAKGSSVTADSATLELTGAGDHTTAATVDAGVSLTMSGSDTQTFSGNMSAFNKALTVNSGTLALTGTLGFTAASVNIAEGAHLKLTGSGDTTISRLTMKYADSTSARVGGTLTYAGGNALTLNSINEPHNQGTLVIENGAVLAKKTAIAEQSNESKVLDEVVVTFADLTEEEAPHRVLAFNQGGTYNSETGELTGGTMLDGFVAGLSGHRGTVIAGTLTINVAEGKSYEFLHRYDESGHTDDNAVLQVNKLYKNGEGTQVIGGEYTTERGFTEKGLYIEDGVYVTGGTLHMKTRGTVTADFSVAGSGTLLTTDNSTNCTSTVGAVKYDGTVTLFGGGTLNYADGSTYITDGLYVDHMGQVINSQDKNQFIAGIYNGKEYPGVLLNFTRAESESNGVAINVLTAAADYEHAYAGTVCLKNENDRNEVYGLQVLGESAKNALARAVVDFSDEGGRTVLSFRNSTEASSDWSNSKMDGSVAGLTGTNGAVYANTLTINTADRAAYTYGGALEVSALTKQGNGEQTIQMNLTTPKTIDRIDAEGGVLTIENSGSGVLTLSGVFQKNGELVLSHGLFAIGRDDAWSNTHGLFATVDTTPATTGGVQLKHGATLNLTAVNNNWRFQLNGGVLNEEDGLVHGGGITIEGAKTEGDDTYAASVFNVDLNDGNSMSVRALNGSGEAAIRATSSLNYSVGSSNVQISNAEVSLSRTADTATTMANQLVNVSFTNAGSAAVNLTNSGNTLVDLHAKDGDITVGASMTAAGFAKADDGKTIGIAENMTLTVADKTAITGKTTDGAALNSVTVNAAGISKTKDATVATISHADITVGTAPAEQGLLALADAVSYDIADVNLVNTNVVSYEQMTVSNVALDADSSITTRNGSTLEGSNRLTLSAGEGIKNGVIVESNQLSGLTLTDGSNLTLDLSAHGYAAGAKIGDKFTIELNDFSWQELADVDAGKAYEGPKDINQVFQVLALGSTDTFYKVLSVTQGVGDDFANSGITLEVQVPEPTTSVLSLLALAGMAARRRRK